MILLDFTTEWLTIYEPAMDGRLDNTPLILVILCFLVFLIGLIWFCWYNIFPEWKTPGSKKWYNYFNK